MRWPTAWRKPASVSSPLSGCHRANGKARGQPMPLNACMKEFKRRIKTQIVLPSAETAAMLFWALIASGQASMRKIDGWRTLPAKPLDQTIDLAAEPISLSHRRPLRQIPTPSATAPPVTGNRTCGGGRMSGFSRSWPICRHARWHWWCARLLQHLSSPSTCCEAAVVISIVMALSPPKAANLRACRSSRR